MLKPEQGPGHMGMLANQVPKAAITELRGLISCGCDKCLSRAIAATLNAWPGMHTHEWQRPWLGGMSGTDLILPLTEKPDGEP